MPIYTSDLKGTGLDAKNPLVAGDLMIVSDPADNGRAKKTTFSQLVASILAFPTFITSIVNLISTIGGGIVQSVNSGSNITVNNADPLNPIINFTGVIPPPGGLINSINGNSTPAQFITNQDTFITVDSASTPGTTKENIDMATLEPAIATALVADNTFLTNLTNSATFQTLVNAFVSGGGGGGFGTPVAWMGAGVQTDDGIVSIQVQSLGGPGSGLTITDTTASQDLVNYNYGSSTGNALPATNAFTFPVKKGSTITITPTGGGSLIIVTQTLYPFIGGGASFANGTFQKDTLDASVVQTIPH